MRCAWAEAHDPARALRGDLGQPVVGVGVGADIGMGGARRGRVGRRGRTEPGLGGVVVREQPLVAGQSVAVDGAGFREVEDLGGNRLGDTNGHPVGEDHDPEPLCGHQHDGVGGPRTKAPQCDRRTRPVASNRGPSIGFQTVPWGPCPCGPYWGRPGRRDLGVRPRAMFRAQPAHRRGPCSRR